jgi:hypothetical protein
MKILALVPHPSKQSNNRLPSSYKTWIFNVRYFLCFY